MHSSRAIVVVVLAVAVVSSGVVAPVGGTNRSARESKVMGSNTQPEVSTHAMAVQEQGNNSSVTFENQSTDGTTVTISQVTLADGGFVAVHDRSLLNGSVLDSVRGVSAYLEPGTHQNVTVTLDEPIQEDQTLFAIAYRDTNGNEEFDFVETQGDQDGAYVVDDQVVVDAAAVTVEAQATETTEESPETTTVETTTEEEPAETTEEDGTTTEEPTETTTVETTTETTAGEPTETTTAAEPALRVTSVVSQQRIDLDAGSLVVNAQIANPSDEEVTETVQVRVNGTVVQERNVTVPAGETVPIQFEVSTDELEPGLNYVGILTRNYGEILRITANETAM